MYLGMGISTRPTQNILKLLEKKKRPVVSRQMTSSIPPSTLISTTSARSPRLRLVETGDVRLAPFEYFDYKGIQECRALQKLKQLAGQGVVVAILDRGLDRRHPAYENSINWQDDVMSFTGGVAGIDETGHGTNIAGIIKRIAPGVRLLIGQCSQDEDDDETQAHSITPLVKGIRWAVNKGADIISISLVTNSYYPELAQAVFEAEMQKVVVVCSASNEGQKRRTNILFPASLGNVLCVGGNDSGSVAPYSPKGREVDFLAPSEDIYTTVPVHMSCPPLAGTESCSFRSGVSMATPFVAALCAVILQIARPQLDYRQLNRLSNFQMKHLIREMCTSGGTHTETTGYGNIDPMRLLQHDMAVFNSHLKLAVGRTEEPRKRGKKRKVDQLQLAEEPDDCRSQVTPRATM
jgi:subtilisin family serine protease